jgi:transcriptional regulator with XRE-family HTH domain
MTRVRKADDPALRAEIERLRRAGQTINREDMAQRFGVTTSVVQVVRSEIDHMLSSEDAPRRRPGGRTVADFSGTQLRAYRTARRLMQDELGQMAGVSRGEIGHLELAHRKPTLKTLRNLESALNVRAGWLQDMPAAEHERNYEEYKTRLADTIEAEGREEAREEAREAV